MLKRTKGKSFSVFVWYIEYTLKSWKWHFCTWISYPHWNKTSCVHWKKKVAKSINNHDRIWFWCAITKIRITWIITWFHVTFLMRSCHILSISMQYHQLWCILPKTFSLDGFLFVLFRKKQQTFALCIKRILYCIYVFLIEYVTWNK